MRLIDADDLDNVVLRLNEEGRTITRSEYKTVDSIIFEFPTIEAELVRRGRWDDMRENSKDVPHIECSACGKPIYTTIRYAYCPNCGAKMEEGEERWNK